MSSKVKETPFPTSTQESESTAIPGQLEESNENAARVKKQQTLLQVESRLQLIEIDDGLQEELLDASLGQYQLYLEQLDAAKVHLNFLLDKTTTTLDLLSEISLSFQTVDSQTSTFRKQTEELLSEQRRNEAVADGIAENFKYYEPLDRITRRLNAPGAGNLVKSRGFSDTLVELDQCIDYMQTHQQQSEAETYRARYRLLLTRALTLVRTQFVNSVREISSEVAKRIADKQLNDTTMSTLLYAKFRVGAAEMKELSLEIHKRANPPADAEPGTEGEYQSLMNELHTSFAASRGRLIVPLMRTKLAEIAQAPSTSKDTATFARSSISYVRGMCLDEFELWGEWFHGQRGLYEFLESICEPLHDHLRSRIIHEVKLPKLCQICTLLQTRYMNQGDDEYEPQDLNDLDFAHLIRPVLEDTQARIVFRAQALLRAEIENFKPRPNDVDYPALLRRQNPSTPGHKPSQSMSSLADDAEEADASISAQERFPLANPTSVSKLSVPYPTLTRAIGLLSMIYRLLNPSIFDDLAHRIVHATTQSFIKAAGEVEHMKVNRTARRENDQPAHSLLFLLTHLLLLKSQIVAFDIEYSPQPEVSFDFSNLTNTFYELQASRGGLFNPLNLVKLVGKGRDLLPRVVENMFDAKEELDGCLRKVIADYVSHEASSINSCLRDESRVKTQSLNETREAIVRQAPLLRSRLEEWIDDIRTRETLVEAVREAVITAYEGFSTNKGAVKAKAKGKGREDEIWDVETFSEWTQNIFGVVVNDDYNGEFDNDAPSRSLSRQSSFAQADASSA